MDRGLAGPQPLKRPVSFIYFDRCSHAQIGHVRTAQSVSRTLIMKALFLIYNLHIINHFITRPEPVIEPV